MDRLGQQTSIVNAVRSQVVLHDGFWCGTKLLFDGMLLVNDCQILVEVLLVVLAIFVVVMLEPMNPRGGR